MTQRKRRLGLTLPPVLHQKIVDVARYQGKTINAMCLEIFWNYFEQRENQR